MTNKCSVVSWIELGHRKRILVAKVCDPVRLARAGEWVMESDLGMEFLFGLIKMFWNQIVVMVVQTLWMYWMSLMVNFMLCVLSLFWKAIKRHIILKFVKSDVNFLVLTNTMIMLVWTLGEAGWRVCGNCVWTLQLFCKSKIIPKWKFYFKKYEKNACVQCFLGRYHIVCIFVSMYLSSSEI